MRLDKYLKVSRIIKKRDKNGTIIIWGNKNEIR